MALRAHAAGVDQMRMLSLHGSAQRLKRRSLLLRFALVSAVLTGLFGTVLALWLASDIRNSSIGATRNNATYSLALALETTHVPGQLSTGLTPAQAVATTNFL